MLLLQAEPTIQWFCGRRHTKHVKLSVCYSLAQMQARWGDEYTDTLFSGGMTFSDGGKLVEDKMLNALVEQGGFVVAFTGKYSPRIKF